MNDERGFLEQIKDDPDDLSTWLVYADWLDEQGDARGEYLRAELELQQLMRATPVAELDEQPQLKQMRRQLTRLARPLNADWVAFFVGFRPECFHCKTCNRAISAQEAIDTNPKTFQRLKKIRYCSSCYEDAVRMNMRQSFQASSNQRFDDFGDDD